MAPKGGSLKNGAKMTIWVRKALGRHWLLARRRRDGFGVKFNEVEFPASMSGGDFELSFHVMRDTTHDQRFIKALPHGRWSLRSHKDATSFQVSGMLP